MQLVGLILIGLILLFIKIISSIFESIEEYKRNTLLNKKRFEKFGNRQIDLSLSLAERNKDIINGFATRIKTGWQSGYYIENATRDCLNEICMAEGQFSLSPGSQYLNSWEAKAPSEWRVLSKVISQIFETTKRNRETEEREMENERKRKVQEAMDEREKNRLAEIMRQRRIAEGVEEIKSSLKAKRETLVSTTKVDKIKFSHREKETININVYKRVLRENSESWAEKEETILNRRIQYKEFPPYTGPSYEASNLNSDITSFNESQKELIETYKKDRESLKAVIHGYEKGETEFVIKRINYIINQLDWPDELPRAWETTFDSEEKIAIIDLKLPDVFHRKIVKNVNLKNSIVEKKLNKKEFQELVPNIHPAIILRIAYEIFRNDSRKKIALLVINGWVEFDDPATGKNKRAYTSSLAVNKEQVADMKLSKIDPYIAFHAMKGKSAGKILEIIPITPVLVMNKDDKRFIETKRVIDGLGSASNLAAMDWQDFESLIAELFERVFNKEGVEVKVTQASRDRGVDAVIFDPDPIRGGKTIIQAKRYTNTVDVSSVRDLCAVVKKEGAIKGILVTTSTFGSDAYAFANNEPITLLNGSELLGLLQEYGYTFKIDLNEARKINAAND